MLLSLGKILDQPGGVVPFSVELDRSDMEFGGQYPATEKVLATGQVRNEAGVLILTGTLDTTLHCVCDRCAAPFDRPFHHDLEAVLVPELASEQNEDEQTFVLKEDAADLEEILNTAFVLNMDARFLCREDCLGICPTCGKDLNDGPCDCKPEPDPRWAALKQLLADQ